MSCSTLSPVLDSRLNLEMEIMYIMLYANSLESKVDAGVRKKELFKEPSLSIEPYYTVCQSSKMQASHELLHEWQKVID
jgi:hypothetical protein